MAEENPTCFGSYEDAEPCTSCDWKDECKSKVLLAEAQRRPQVPYQADWYRRPTQFSSPPSTPRPRPTPITNLPGTRAAPPFSPHPAMTFPTGNQVMVQNQAGLPVVVLDDQVAAPCAGELFGEMLSSAIAAACFSVGGYLGNRRFRFGRAADAQQAIPMEEGVSAVKLGKCPHCGGWTMSGQFCSECGKTLESS